jgi:hypothetical protein
MASCVASTRKKYTSRSSPPYPAQACKGQTKKGNDGKTYLSQPTATGVYRWVPLSVDGTRKRTPGVTSYLIHDNGGRFFRVEVTPSKKTAEVFYKKEGDITDQGKSILRTRYTDIFIGENKTPETRSIINDKGNSILLHISKANYIYIGHMIQSFETREGEKIKSYYSPIGNSDVPYPYAIGEQYTYFMLDMDTIPNELLDLSKDAYPQYYGHSFRKTEEDKAHYKKVIEPAIRGVRHKMIHKSHY